MNTTPYNQPQDILFILPTQMKNNNNTEVQNKF